MDLKHIYSLLVAVIAFGVVLAQNQDELQIPVENDNQFPPEQHADNDEIPEGSGVGVLEEPEEIQIDSTPLPRLEDTELVSTKDELITISEGQFLCPSLCVCNTEGANFEVDCSRLDLTEFPAPIDSMTTKLNLQYNKLKEIPKDISTLKNLKILNAKDNAIMEIAPGSISELPELTHLSLDNNRLLEYPKDLKNSLSLTKLKELSFSGNDIRTEFSSTLFTNFLALEKLTVPTSTQDFVENICSSIKSLQTVCTESCTIQANDCLNVPQNVEDDLTDAVLPGTIALSSFIDDNVDPSVKNLDTDDDSLISVTEDLNDALTSTPGRIALHNDLVPDFRSAVDTAPGEVIQSSSTENNLNNAINTNAEIKVSEATTVTKTGGVDKSVIGFVVAGMVLIVAGITIKKNWSSIRKRFSSSPRPNERVENNANGTTPEEVPLQDKSPV